MLLDEARLKDGAPPFGWEKQRWQKHVENTCRAERLTGIVPFDADGWEKVAVLLMDKLEGK